MSREQLEHKLSQKFGIIEGHNKYSKIKDLLIYTYKHINECAFSTDFYDKIFDLL